MLISNTTELKEYIPASVTLDFADIRPKVRLVEREIIQRIFSIEVYEHLIDPAATATEDVALKKLLAEAVAHLALLDYLAFGQVQINSSGVQIASNETMKTAFEWQIDEIKTQCSRQGWSAVESALEYCESLPDGDLKDLWEETNTYTTNQSRLLPTLRKFETFVNLGHSRVLFNKLAPIIQDQQEEVIEPAVGSALFAKMLAYESESDATKKAALTKAHKLASRALAYFAAGSGFQDSMLILSDNGPLVINGMQSRLSKAKLTPPTELVQLIADSYQSRAGGALRELIEYCQANATVLPEYEESPNFISDADQTEHIPRNDPDWGIAFF
jgi:hypothetical protein